MDVHLLVHECDNCLLTHSGDVSCLATIPSDVEAEATFITKADGVIAGISLADMIFNQVDPSLKVSTLYLLSHLRFWKDMIIYICVTGGINCTNCSLLTNFAG